MARNIELKARHDALDEARAVAEGMGAPLISQEYQRDTYFAVARGRLKLRERRPEGEPATAELILYDRPDAALARGSDYLRCLVSDAEIARQFVELTHGITVQVVKNRLVYLHDNVRIHLDTVETLGTFIEFEAIVDEYCDDANARAKLEALQTAFTISPEQIHKRSYADMMTKEALGGPGSS